MSELCFFKVNCSSSAAFSSFFLLDHLLSLHKLKYIYFSSTIPHSFFSNCLSDPISHHWSSSLYCLLCGGMMGLVGRFFFFCLCFSILMSWVASVFSVLLAVIFQHSYSFAIFVTSSLLSTIPWWAYKGHPNFFVCVFYSACLFLPLLFTKGQIKHWLRELSLSLQPCIHP